MLVESAQHLQFARGETPANQFPPISRDCLTQHRPIMHPPAGGALLEAEDGAIGTEGGVEIPLWASASGISFSQEAARERAGAIVTLTADVRPRVMLIELGVMTDVTTTAAESVKSEAETPGNTTFGKETPHLLEPQP